MEYKEYSAKQMGIKLHYLIIPEISTIHYLD